MPKIPVRYVHESKCVYHGMSAKGRRENVQDAVANSNLNSVDITHFCYGETAEAIFEFPMLSYGKVIQRVVIW